MTFAGDCSAIAVAAALAVVIAAMLAELALSRRNERVLRERGAFEAPDPVYGTMRWAYPLAFVVMAAEGLLRGAATPGVIWSGVVVLLLAKVLKAWAILSLGHRWTYKVLVLPGAPLVRTGPYARMRHPNYVAVVGELVGMALVCGAWWTGPVAVAGFGLLLRGRIAAEERALGLAS